MSSDAEASTATKTSTLPREMWRPTADLISSSAKRKLRGSFTETSR